MKKISIKHMIDWCTDHRNLLFLEVCLVIHALYMGLFSMLNIWFLSLLNLWSCGYYIDWLLLKKDTSEKSMVYTYFEILLFSIISEVALGPEYGFFLYIVGMAAAVFYLLPSCGNMRFLYQIIGIAAAMILEGTIKIVPIDFPSIREPLEPYKNIFFLVNLGITATIVLGATVFYSNETERVWESLRYSMNHDVLTGLYNRRFLERQIEETPRSERSQYVISMVDIDFFKKVNDTYGHEAGDAVLVEVAACLKAAAGKENLAVRWGGEEFILYFPKATPETVYPIMEALRTRIEGLTIKNGTDTIQVTITSGISTGMADSNYEKIINSADEKLYLGKQRGRNRVIV